MLLCEDFFHAAASFPTLHRSSHAVALVLTMKRENSMCHTTQWRSQRQQQKKVRNLSIFLLSLSCVVKLFFEFPPYFVCRCCLFFFCGIIELKCHTCVSTSNCVQLTMMTLYIDKNPSVDVIIPPSRGKSIKFNYTYDRYGGRYTSPRRARHQTFSWNWVNYTSGIEHTTQVRLGEKRENFLWREWE